jgi:hypothetical protein
MGSFGTLFRLGIVILIANLTKVLAGIVDKTAESAGAILGSQKRKELGRRARKTSDQKNSLVDEKQETKLNCSPYHKYKP